MYHSRCDQIKHDHLTIRRGIGLESSILFAREGAHVLLVDINLEAAEKGAALITQRYPNVKALATKADVGKEADIKGAVDKAVKEFGRLDVMVGQITHVNITIANSEHVSQFNNAGQSAYMYILGGCL